MATHHQDLIPDFATLSHKNTLFSASLRLRYCFGNEMS